MKAKFGFGTIFVLSIPNSEIMKAVLTLLFGIIMLLPQEVDKGDVIGNWEGKIEAPGVDLKIVFHITYLNKELGATMDSPSQDAFGLKMDEVKYTEQGLEMTIKQYNGTFKGKAKDGKIIGKWTQGGQTFDLNLTRIKRTGTS